MSKHTTGPWFTGRMLDPRDAPCVIGDGDSVVAILPGKWNGCTYIPGDAQLMAAAPELLRAASFALDTLTMCLDEMCADPCHDAGQAAAIELNRRELASAIAKAEGR